MYSPLLHSDWTIKASDESCISTGIDESRTTCLVEEVSSRGRQCSPLWNGREGPETTSVCLLILLTSPPAEAVNGPCSFHFEESAVLRLCVTCVPIGIDLQEIPEERDLAVQVSSSDGLWPGNAPCVTVEIVRRLFKPTGRGYRSQSRASDQGTAFVATKALQTRLIDYLKSGEVTTLFTDLMSAGQEGDHTDEGRILADGHVDFVKED